mgnify:CR=1 FL=1
MIKKVLGVFLFLFLVVQCSPKQGDKTELSQEKPIQKTIVTFVLGKAFVKPVQGEWTSLKVGNFILPQDSIRLQQKARVTLQTETGSVITLKDETEIVLNSFLDPQTKKEDTTVVLNAGKAIVNPRKLKDNSSFAVRTPAMVAGVRGTIFSVEYRNGSSKVAVKEGKVAVKPNLSSLKGISPEVEDQIEASEIKPGEKAELSTSQIEQVAKSFEGETKEEQFKELQEKIQLNTLSQEETKEVEQEATTLTKLDLDLQEKETSLASVTISSYGQEIFINEAKVANDYYSSFYTEGSSLNVKIMKGGQAIYQENISVPMSGINLNLTQPAEEEKALEEVTKEISQASLFQEIASGFSVSAQEFFQIDKNMVFSHSGNVSILLEDNPKQKVQIASLPNVEPALTPEGVFVINRNGDLELYGFDGRKKAETKLGNFIFKTAFSYDNGIGYIGNATGKIIGIKALSGDKVLDISVKDSLVAPVGVYQDMLFALSPYKLFVLQKGRIINDFPLKGKVFKRMGTQENKLILPYDNGVISIVDFKGKVIKDIKAVAGDIFTLTPNVFAIKYASKAIFYTHEGQKLKEASGKNTIFVGSKGIWSVGKEVFIYDVISQEETRLEFPENIKSLGIAQNKIAVITDSTKLYHANF